MTLNLSNAQDTIKISTCVNDTIQFTCSLKYYSSYEWYFSDGNFSSIEAPTHIFTQSGIFYANVTAFDLCCPNNGKVQLFEVNVYDDINCIHDSDYFTFFPNPANSNVYVNYHLRYYNGWNNIYSFKILDVNTSIEYQTHTLNPLESIIELEISSIPTGYYSIALLKDGVVIKQLLFFKN